MGLASAAQAAETTGNAKVDALMARMTLAEKISMLHGAGEPADTDQGEAGYLPGVKRLGIPPMRFADGPPGVLTRVPGLALTATMGLAATFSTEDARLNGVVIAHQARSHGISVVLQPFINMDRDLAFTRAYNTFGEDPFLTGQMGAAQIGGIQSNGIMAQAKHYIGYDNGNSARNGDVTIDDQTLHEVYAAPFDAAIKAGVSSIMCSYNTINGAYACGNDKTLNGLLRGEMGFTGFVTSDWGAVHATDFINAGLDLEMSGPMLNNWQDGTQYFYQGPRRTSPDDAPKTVNTASPLLPEELPIKADAPALKPAPVAAAPAAENLAGLVAAGKVSTDTIDRAVGRILLQMDRFGYLDGADTTQIRPYDLTADAAIVEQTAIDSAVLLKNDGGILPLKAGDLSATALIGPNAGQLIPVAATVEKAPGIPEREVGPLAALEALGGTKDIAYAVADDMDGHTIPTQYLSHAGYAGDHEPGLERRMWNYPSVVVDPAVDFTTKRGNALPVNASVVWSGTLSVPAEGIYDLNLQLLGARGKLIVDDTIVSSVWYNWIHGERVQPGQDNIFPSHDGLDNLRARRKLAAGPHTIRIEVDPDSSDHPAQVRLSWVTPAQRQADHDAAIAAAKKAHTAVVFAWSRSIEPVFQLPGDQDQLIGEIAAVNPNTVVVLNTSQPVAMPWLGQVKGVVEMWWTGDEGGTATAKILLGQADPAGRLPFTWPVKRTDMPVDDPRHPERTLAGIDGKTTYSEGLFIGYKWFDRQGVKPLFPFGYGLSYTHFDYAHLSAAKTADGGLDVHATVRNSGAVAGDEVAQIYLGKPDAAPADVPFADNALAGFARVHLAPGQSQDVSIHVAPRQLQYWSSAKQAWLAAPAARALWIGGSSRDRRQTVQLNKQD